MKPFKNYSLYCLCLCLLLTCGSDDDNSISDFDIIGKWTLISVYVVEAGQPDVNITPPCLLDLIFTANLYYELLKSGANCNTVAESNRYPYELNDAQLKIFNEDGDVLYDFGFNKINTTSFELMTSNINGVNGLSAVAKYEFTPE